MIGSGRVYDIYKQKLQLLMSMEEIITEYSNGAHIPNEVWDDFREGLIAFDLSFDNVQFECIDDIMRSGASSDVSFVKLKKQFSKFFDAQVAAAANSSMISADFRQGIYGCDREFMHLINYIRGNSIDALAYDVYSKLVKLSQDDSNYYELVTIKSRGWYMEANWLDGVDGKNNSLIYNRVATLKLLINEIEWLYDNLSDALSRQSLNALIKYWLTWDFTDWKRVAIYYCDVVDTMVFPFYDDEVFVDCGGYVGDTVVKYVNTVNSRYKHVYTYEVSSTHIELIKRNLSSLNNVTINHKGTGDRETKMTMIGTDNVNSGNSLVIESNHPAAVEEVDVVRIDDDIQEPITFLKIDVEGMDKESLEGARGLINKFHPKLSVDAYHKLADIVDVPMLIRDIDKSYTLHLRLPLISEAHLRFPFPTIFAV